MPVEIIKADKGDKIVVFDKQQYEQMVLEHLGSGPYKIIRNPLPSTITDLKNTINSLRYYKSSESKKWKVVNPVVQKLYGLPKIHKVHLKFARLRVIASSEMACCGDQEDWKNGK